MIQTPAVLDSIDIPQEPQIGGHYRPCTFTMTMQTRTSVLFPELTDLTAHLCPLKHADEIYPTMSVICCTARCLSVIEQYTFVS